MLFFYQFTKSLISNRSLLCLSMLHLSKRDSSMGVILAWSMVSLYAKMSPCSTPSYNLKDALLLNSLFFSVSVRDPLRSLYSRPSPMTISSVHNIIPREKKPPNSCFFFSDLKKKPSQFTCVIFQSTMKQFSMACNHLFCSQSVSTTHGTLQNSPCYIFSSLFLHCCCQISRFYGI